MKICKSCKMELDESEFERYLIRKPIERWSQRGYCKKCGKIKQSNYHKSRYKSWYSENSSKIREYMRNWIAKNRERRKTYSSTSYSKISNNPELKQARYEKSLAFKLANKEEMMVRAAKCRAKARGWECTITSKDIVIPETCPILGLTLITRVGFNDDHSPTLDRIDNTKGYVPDNVRVISRLANLMKNKATVEQLLLFCKNMPEYLKSSQQSINNK